MFEPSDHTPDIDPQALFLEMAVQYLDNQLPDDQAEAFFAATAAAPEHRRLFVSLCIQSQLLIEKMAAQSASDLLLRIDPNKALHGVPVPREASQTQSEAAPIAPPRSSATSGRQPQFEDLTRQLQVPGTRAPSPVPHSPGSPRRPRSPDAPEDAEESRGASTAEAHPRSWGLPARSSKRILRWAAAVLLPVLAGGVIYSLTHRIHATLSAVAGAQWGAPFESLQPGQALPSQPLFLASGVARIDLRNGASFLVEGPAHFQLRSDLLAELILGRLAATVPAAARGFTVRTANSRLVDLGTEFGVSVGADGATSVDVFKGRVEAFAQLAGTGAAKSRVLTVGEAAQISSSAITLSPGGAVLQRFVRSLQPVTSALDVVDLIAGGDGTGEHRNIAIDPRTGEVGPLKATGPYTVDASTIASYHRVPALPVVDGTFIPSGTTQVDSTGHTFDFSTTSGNSFNHIWVGGDAPFPPEFSPPAAPAFIPVLGEVDYRAHGHGFVFLHSNKGLTLDLAAIRRLHPGTGLASLAAQVGNVAAPNIPTKADVVVLVDGKTLFERDEFTNRDGPFSIRVPLTSSDRFLTLAVTDGGDGTSYDWVIFGDPKLELAAVAAK